MKSDSDWPCKLVGKKLTDLCVDLGLSDDMFESFIKYQNMLAKGFHRMQKRYGLIPTDGNRTIEEINADLLKRISDFLNTASVR